MEFSHDFSDFVKLLIDQRVKYLIIGGSAVGAHGQARYSGDMDIWIDALIENAGKVLEAVK
jgi:hypothetical protein